MSSNSCPKARLENLVVQELDDETLVYDLDADRAHCLNASAALVWKSCDGTNSVSDIVDQFEVSGGGKVTEDFVWLAVDQLSVSDLLENKLAARFTGRSRRQILKTIGLATAAALPVIASIVAPQNALGNTSCFCTDPGQTTQCTTMPGCPMFCGPAGECRNP